MTALQDDDTLTDERLSFPVAAAVIFVLSLALWARLALTGLCMSGGANCTGRMGSRTPLRHRAGPRWLSVSERCWPPRAFGSADDDGPVRCGLADGGGLWRSATCCRRTPCFCRESDAAGSGEPRWPPRRNVAVGRAAESRLVPLRAQPRQILDRCGDPTRMDGPRGAVDTGDARVLRRLDGARGDPDFLPPVRAKGEVLT